MLWILRRCVPLSRIRSQCNGHCLKDAARVILRRSFIRPFKMRLTWRAWSMSCATASSTAASEFRVVLLQAGDHPESTWPSTHYKARTSASVSASGTTVRAEQQQCGHDAGRQRHPAGGHRAEEPARPARPSTMPSPAVDDGPGPQVSRPSG